MGGENVTEIERNILEVVPQTRLMEGAKLLKCSEFGDAIISNM